MKAKRVPRGLAIISGLLCLVILLAGCAKATPTTSYQPPAYTTPSMSTVSPTMTPSVTVPSAGQPPAANFGGGATGLPSQSVGSAPSYAESSSDRLGFAVGGAKDINNFRDNIDQGYLPLVSDITVEGLYYDYYFDTGDPGPSEKLFSPAYNQAVSRDPFSGETEYYLAVGLNSGLSASDFERQHLNLVLVIDVSGSMGSPFDQYYYDSAGQRLEVSELERDLSKMQVAQEAVLDLIKNLDRDDRVGVVVFNDRARVLQPLAYADGRDLDDVCDEISRLRAGGSTNLAAGMDLATGLYDEHLGYREAGYENRIILITDAMPNTGDTSRYGLFGMVADNADDNLYTTFIGVGVDFNSQLIDYIGGVRGANYYSMHSPAEFRRRLDAEFDYMVTPLVFDLELRCQSNGWEIETVYGSPQTDISSGRLMYVSTLFPSESSGGETRGGLILLKLRRTGGGDAIWLTASYEDRDGERDRVTRQVWFDDSRSEQFDNDGVRKGVLLARYAILMQLWIQDERQHAHYSAPWEPCWEREDGIGLPLRMGLSEWERQSLPLMVSREYRQRFAEFAEYYDGERRAIGDSDLKRELMVLEMLTD